MGCPLAVADEIQVASDEPQYDETTISYNALGYPSVVSHNNGASAVLQTDTLGRVRVKQSYFADNLVGSEEYDYSPEGYLLERRLLDRLGASSGKTVWQYDLEGRVLGYCTEREASGCAGVVAGVGTGSLPVGTASAPSIVVGARQYSPGGRLTAASDAEGTTETVGYDGLMRPNVVHVGGREIGYDWTDQGRLAGKVSGPLTSYYYYDGFGQLVRSVDERGVPWQYAWDAFGRLTARKQSAVGFDVLGDTPSWHERWVRDPLGRVTQEMVNGQVVTTYNRLADGRLESIQSLGGGITYVGQDYSGAIIWTKDEAGAQLLRLENQGSGRAVQVELEQNAAGQRVVSELATRDWSGGSGSITRFGRNGETQVWSIARDDRGFIQSILPPDGMPKSFPSRNLLGWPTAVDLTGGASSAETRTYNARGQLERIVDPHGQATRFYYTVLGELAALERGGLVEQYHYDDAGRVFERVRPDGATIEYTFDGTLPQTATWMNDPNADVGPSYIGWGYDALGRVEATTTFSSYLQKQYGAGTVTGSRTFDNLGRAHTEGLVVAGVSDVRGQYDWTTYTQATGAQAWQRDADTSWGHSLEAYDVAGRLALLQGARGLGVSWLGGAMQQRTVDGASGPIVGARTFDGFGVPKTWSVWRQDSSSSSPLYDLEVQRDPLGRTTSEQWRFGDWLRDSTGTLTDDPGRRTRWRGYRYGAQNELLHVWEQDLEGGYFDTTGFVSYTGTATGGWIGYITDTAGIAPWTYSHPPDDASVGAILDPTGAAVWQATGHDSAYRLTSARLGANTYAIDSDGSGRLTAGPGWNAGFDAFDHLVWAERDGTREAYAYDASGRMVARFDASGLKEVFGYDHDQLVAGLDPSGHVNWRAVAIPGERGIRVHRAGRADAGAGGGRSPERGGAGGRGHGEIVEELDYTPYGRVR